MATNEYSESPRHQPSPVYQSPFALCMQMDYWADNRGQRIGQFAYNYLAQNYSVEVPVPTEVDCFHDDSLLTAFLSWVESNRRFIKRRPLRARHVPT